MGLYDERLELIQPFGAEDNEFSLWDREKDKIFVRKKQV